MVSLAKIAILSGGLVLILGSGIATSSIGKVRETIGGYTPNNSIQVTDPKMTQEEVIPDDTIINETITDKPIPPTPIITPKPAEGYPMDNLDNIRNGIPFGGIRTYQSEAATKGRGKQFGSYTIRNSQKTKARGTIYNNKERERYGGLKTDTFNRPIETASQYKNRIASNKNAEKPVRNRGESSSIYRARLTDFKNVKKAVSSFNFGTNTGKGRKIKTTNRGGEKKSTTDQPRTTKKDLKREEDRARKIFNSSSISNF